MANKMFGDYQSAETKIERQIILPFKDAFRISLRNITIRFGRAVITAAGTFLGIAFLMSVFTGSALMEAAQQGQMDPSMTARKIWLVVMSLLVCGVGITNSMLMSVTERFREIGTMKCLGALDNFIIRLYLIESALMGVGGSVGGAIVGTLAMVLVSLMKGGAKILPQVDWLHLLQYFGISVVIGSVISVVAAVPAARHAAKMPAAAALRTEI